MDIQDTRLSLGGYRIQVLERLRTCENAGRARDLLAEVDVMLGTRGLSPRVQRAFWHALGTDLTVVAEESAALLGKEAAARLTAIIEAAEADIAQYLSVLSS